MSVLVLAPLRELFDRLFPGRAPRGLDVPGVGRLEHDAGAWRADIPRAGAPRGVVKLCVSGGESGCTPDQLALATSVIGDLDRFERGALSVIGADASTRLKVFAVHVEEDDGTCTPIVMASGGRLALDLWLDTPDHDGDDEDGLGIVSCVVGGTPQRPEFYKDDEDGCTCPRCKAG